MEHNFKKIANVDAEAKAPVFKHHYNAIPSTGESDFGPSQTIPDQSMSIKEIMRRYAKGLPLNGERVPIWEGEDNDLPDFEKMDLAEREEYKQQLQAELYALNQRLKKADEPKEETTPKVDKNASIQEAEIIEEDNTPPPSTKNKKTTS